MCIHSHPCDVWCMKVFIYMCAHVGEQVHTCTHLHASNVECFPRVPGSELRTSGTLLIDHLHAPQTPVPARTSNGNHRLQYQLAHLMGTTSACVWHPEGTKASRGSFFSHVARSALDVGAGGMPWITCYSGLEESFSFLLIPPNYTLSLLLTINKQKKIKL